jgi:hypothetical protein
VLNKDIYLKFPIVVKKQTFSRQVPVHQPFHFFTKIPEAIYAGHKSVNAVERAVSQHKTFIQHYGGTSNMQMNELY